MEKTMDAEFSARFPTIHNCNFWCRGRDGDVLGGDVWGAIIDVFEHGCDDEAVIDALESLEATLAEHAERDNALSVAACHAAEEAVQQEWRSMKVTAGRWQRRLA